MIFPYQSVIAVSPVTGESEQVLRPDILVGVEGPQDIRVIVGLVDTGADYSVLPRSIAEATGIALRPVIGPSVVGMGGHELSTALGDVQFVLEDDETTLTWTSPVLFHESDDELGGVLGRTGFLEYFTATFDAESETVTLIPNARFPGEVELQQT